MNTVPFGAFKIMMLTLRCLMAYSGELRILKQGAPQGDIDGVKGVLGRAQFTITHEDDMTMEVKHEGHENYRRLFEAQYVGNSQI